MLKHLKISLILVLFWPLTSQAIDLNLLMNSGFNPNYLISDREMTDFTAWNQDALQKFLESKPGVLAGKKFTDLDGQEKSAGEIIYQNSQRYQINPQVLLALLQKEQSLVENPNPSAYNFDWAAGYGRCDSCDQNDPNIAKFKGFAKQVDSAAGALRFFLETGKDWLKQPGLIYNIDSRPIIPANQATANLYTYTPHLEGNYNFWRVWQKWFAKIFPDGVTVRDEQGQIWLIQDGKKYPFQNKTAFFSRCDPRNLLTASERDLSSYEKGPAIKFPNFSLVKIKKGGTYLLAGRQKRLIEPAAFRHFGFNPEEVVAVKEEDLAPYLSGEPVTIKKKYPLGVLMQDKKSGGVYYVADGIKSPVWDRNILKTNFPTRPLKKTTAIELKKYPTGEPVKFADGTLLKTAASPEIYLISNGERRLIRDEATFSALGWRPENIVTAAEKVLAMHPLGEPISLTPTVSPTFISLNQ